MASDAFIAFLFAIGFSGWVFSKTQQRTGGNTTNSLVAAGGAAVLGFILILIIMSFVPNPS